MAELYARQGKLPETESLLRRSLAIWETTLPRFHPNVALAIQAGRRPVYGGTQQFQIDPHWKDYLLFYEYFYGDNDAGLGASHQTGWTGLVAKLIELDGAQFHAAG
jgi:hypothetical protein